MDLQVDRKYVALWHQHTWMLALVAELLADATDALPLLVPVSLVPLPSVPLPDVSFVEPGLLGSLDDAAWPSLTKTSLPMPLPRAAAYVAVVDQHVAGEA